MPRTAEQRRADSQKYYAKNKVEYLARNKVYRDANRERIRARLRMKRANGHLEIENQRRRIREGRLPRSEYLEKIRVPGNLKNARHRMRHTYLRAIWDKVSDRERAHIGCSSRQLRAWLGSQFTEGMTWGNYGTFWNVDHLEPVIMFDLLDPEDFRKCCHFANLRPMRCRDNYQSGIVARTAFGRYKRPPAAMITKLPES